MVPELPIFIVTAIVVAISIALLHHSRHDGKFDEPQTLNTRGDDE